ncbi:MAG TPA: lysophospholipid acyltransferase family protein [Spirochaetota bacterium]|nr:lysophospholipid acyltransferase family protein [Spirochaetota bacterium]
MAKLLKFIFSLPIWIIFWINATISIAFFVLISFIIPKKFYNPLVVFVCKFLTYSLFIFPVCKGKSPKEVGFPVIYVANHVTFFDLFICGSVLPGYPRGLELKSHFTKPIYGWFITRFGEIPLDTKNRTSIKESFLAMSRILKNKERSILVMPEGKRSRDGKIQEFKYGAFHLSRLSGAPIVPVVFKRLYDRNNPTSLMIKPGSFDVIIMDEVKPEDFEDDDSMGNYVRNLMINKLEE